jgi:hypothetical protein
MRRVAGWCGLCFIERYMQAFRKDGAIRLSPDRIAVGCG